jgi:Cu/Ag efflux protein CusF
MKRLSNVSMATSIVLFATFFLILAAGMAQAADKMLTATLSQDVVTKLDKNGNEYSRAIFSEPRSLDGVTYQKDVVIMAFGDKSADLKGMKAGDALKAVVSENIYKGNLNYVLEQKVE